MSPVQYEKHLSDKLIKKFIDSYFEKVGKHVFVIVSEDNDEDPLVVNRLEYAPTLCELKKLVEEFIPDKYPKNLALKCRKRDIVTLRQIFSLLAHTMGYSYKNIGSQVGLKNHTTILYSKRKAKHLLETGDIITMSYYKKVTSKLKYDFGYYTTNSTAKTNSQSVLPATVLQGQS